jgi:hypothetical protein
MAKDIFTRWAEKEAEKKRFPDGKGTKLGSGREFEGMRGAGRQAASVREDLDVAKMKYVDIATGDYYDDYRGYRTTKSAVEAEEQRYIEAEYRMKRAAMERMGEVEYPPRDKPVPTARETIMHQIDIARRDGNTGAMHFWLEKLHEYDTGGAPKMEQKPIPQPLPYDRDKVLRQIKLCRERMDNVALAHWLKRLEQIDGFGEGEYVEKSGGTIKATLHKAGHFPTQWMTEAVDRAEASEMCITITVEREGVLVTAMEADERFDIRVTDWEAMEHSEVNPLIKAIEDSEKKLRMLQKVKEASGH